MSKDRGCAGVASPRSRWDYGAARNAWSDMADDAADLPEAAQRALASRRRELEREFDLKRADLKVQHQRRLEVLEQEKRDWLEHKRQQAKELADRTEKVRRNTANTQQRSDLAATERKELADLRAQVRDLERKEREAARTEKGLREAVEAAQRRGRAARVRAVVAIVVALLLVVVVVVLLRR